LRSLFAVAENYPQLRAVESFLQLQETLTATEDKIEFSRRFYNTSARDFNTALQTFPRNLFGNMLGFKPFSFFTADEGDRAVPQVSFDQAPAVGFGAPSATAPPTGSEPPAAAPGSPTAPTAGT
jgi:LemA protein